MKYMIKNEDGQIEIQIIRSMNITVRQSRQSGVARATCPD